MGEHRQESSGLHWRASQPSPKSGVTGDAWMELFCQNAIRLAIRFTRGGQEERKAGHEKLRPELTPEHGVSISRKGELQQRLLLIPAKGRREQAVRTLSGLKRQRGPARLCERVQRCRVAVASALHPRQGFGPQSGLCRPLTVVQASLSSAGRQGLKQLGNHQCIVPRVDRSVNCGSGCRCLWELRALGPTDVMRLRATALFGICAVAYSTGSTGGIACSREKPPW